MINPEQKEEITSAIVRAKDLLEQAGTWARESAIIASRYGAYTSAESLISVAKDIRHLTARLITASPS